MSVTERRFQINGSQLAAREWHAGAAIKVIASHGWLDNAASFDALAARLPKCHIIALDMPGHGYSDHKPPQAQYNIWDDLLDILAVADIMQWQRFHILGHSRGAIMAMLLAASMPERVASLIMLDAMLPEPFDVAKTAGQLAKFLNDQRSIQQKKRPKYASIEEALAVRCRVAAMSECSARPIVERGLVRQGDDYYWVYDPRLNTASAFKLTEDHLRVLVDAISVPNLLLLAESGLGANKDYVKFIASYRSIRYELIPGSHHFHMEEQAPIIAEKLSRFLLENTE